MEEILIVVLVLTVFLALVTLIGHGIWVLLAAMFTSERSEKKTTRPCPFCNQRTPLGKRRCQFCGHELHSELAEELADIAAVDRQLRRFQSLGLIERTEVQDYLRHLNAYQRRLRFAESLASADPITPDASEPGAMGGLPALAATAADEREKPIVAELVDEALASSEPATAEPVVAKPGAGDGSPVAGKARADKPPMAPDTLKTPDIHRAPDALKARDIHRTPDVPRAPQTVAAMTATARPAPMVEPTPVRKSLAARRPASKPPVPRRSVAEMLSAFMEDHNMRWGEMVGGLLIIGCSAALVLSYWSTLQRFEFTLPLIFAAITAAVFGVGLWSYHRWKLESTGRGMLIIATLLVPLNFLATAGGGPSQPVWSLLSGAMQIALLGMFAWLTAQAAGVLVPRGRWLMSAAVTANAAAALVIGRWIAPSITSDIPLGWITATACLPVAVFCGAIAGYCYVTRRLRALGTAKAAQLFTLLGLATFSLAVSLGLLGVLAVRSLTAATVLDALAAPLALAAMPLTTVGLLVRQRTVANAKLEAYRTAGTTVALLGMVGQLASLLLAWPHPAGLIAVGTLNAVALTIAAIRYRMSELHAGAIACLTLVYVVGFQTIYHHGPWMFADSAQAVTMLAHLLDASSGTALAGLFVLLAVISEVFARTGYRRDGLIYAAGASVVAVAGLLLVTYHGLAGGGDAVRASILYTLYGTVALGLAARWRRIEASYLGLGLLTLAPLWAAWRATEPVMPPWAMLFAAEALLLGIVATVLVGWTARQSGRQLRDRHLRNWQLRRLIVQTYDRPLMHTALALTVAAVVALPFDWALDWITPGSLVLLAAAWLVAAVRRRSPELFALHQGALAVACVAGTMTWLHVGLGRAPSAAVLLSSSALVAYGIALATFALFWILVRLALRRSAAADRLLNPSWPNVDRVVCHTVIWSHLALLAYWSSVGVGQELSTTATVLGVSQFGLFGASAWLLWAVTGLVVLLALWNRFAHAELAATVALAATAACLVANGFAADRAVASALRWSLAVCLLGGSVAVWERGALRRWLDNAQTCLVLRDPQAAQLARRLLLCLAAAPVLGLTVLAAMEQLSGHPPGGPAANTLFAQFGATVSYVVPLLLVMTALVGHAVRERSAGYAFSAGLVAEMIVVLGYPLYLTTVARQSFEEEHFVVLAQLATITAAVWAIAWLTLRRWLDVWRETPSEPTTARTNTVYMNLQLAFGATGNVLLLLPTVCLLALLGPFRGGISELTAPVGSWLGWTALALAVVAYAYRRLQLGRALRPQLVGLIGMTTIALLAVTVNGFSQQWGIEEPWGYRTLMLGWALYAVAVVAATWWAASLRTAPEAQGPPQAMIRLASVWVTIPGLAAVLLGLYVALPHAPSVETLWAALSIAIASVAAATMAVWRRREGWALAAAPGVNLAASLVVWYVNRDARTFDDWLVQLVQANLIASSAVALAWLAVRRRLYQLRELSLGESPLLAVQVALPAVGNLVVWAVPVGWLVLHPRALPDHMAHLADAPGWLALVLSAVAAAWYVLQIGPRRLLDVLAPTTLGAGVLTVCHTTRFTRFSPMDYYSEYHLLITLWATAGLALLVLGIFARAVRCPGKQESTGSSRSRLFPRTVVRDWVTLVAGVVLLLSTIHVSVDPVGVWWYARAILAVAVMCVALATWLRQLAYVFASGVVLCALATVLWIAYGTTLYDLAWANVIALAGSAIFWTLLDRLLPDGVPHARIGLQPLPYAHLAVQVAAAIVALAAAVALLVDLADGPHYAVAPITWIALGLTAFSALATLGDHRARFVWPVLYGQAFSLLALALVARDLSPRMIYWSSVCEMTGLMLVIALVAWAVPKARGLWTLSKAESGKRKADERTEKAAGGFATGTDNSESGKRRLDAVDGYGWFHVAQAVVASLGTALALWVSLSFAFDGLGEGIALFGLAGRMAAVPAALILLGATIVMAWQSTGTTRRRWQYAAIAMGLALNCTSQWAGIPATMPGGMAVIWLHRTVALLIGGTMLTLVCSMGLARVLPRATDWIDAGRRAVPTLAAVAAVGLVLTLGQEIALFDAASETGVPLARWAVVVVVLALVGLAAGCIACAVVPELDRFRLSPRGRTVYVYAAEVLAALVPLHLWLTEPQLFRLGIVEKYWMLIVMAVAFAGAGLSEWFQRRRLAVLSEPLANTALLLPAIPAIGFWFMPLPPMALALVGRTPMLWLLIALFYGLMAVMRRSALCTLLGLLCGTMGVWVALHQYGPSLMEHPQLWVIPLAMAALVAEYLHRDRLTENQQTALRYLALAAIYVASTTDMFLHGVGQDWRLPLALMLLCVAGILLGIMLRIRSFLFLGATFLVLDLISIVWYAAFGLGQRWILYASGIALGAAIIAMFALFEKRRNDIRDALGQLKQWQG